MSHSVCEMKKRIIEAVDYTLDQGFEKVNAQELAAAVHMINELSEAEYYEKIGKAMDDYGAARPMPKTHHKDWGYSEDETMEHGEMIGNPMDIRTMDPEHQLMHLQKDVEAMWKDASPEHRKKLKESLAKWSTSLTA